MAEVLNLFPSRVRFVNVDGTLTAEAYRALQSLMVRVGGPVAPTISDLDVQQYADAGIEETRAMLLTGFDAFASAPPSITLSTDEIALQPIDIAPLLAGLEALQVVPVSEFSPLDQLSTEISELREAVFLLQTEIDNLKQGTLL